MGGYKQQEYILTVLEASRHLKSQCSQSYMLSEAGLVSGLF